LFLGDTDLGPDGINLAVSLKSLPALFNSENLVEKQFCATSEDGTVVIFSF
jgi:prolyl oligopeptidase PreP (S9A serine peptidase family)